MKRNKLYAAVLAASFVVSAPALFAATAAKPAPTASALAANNNAKVSQQDQQFIDNAWNINATEVRLGKIAEHKATNADVKAFGKKMVTDHSMLQKELESLATEHDATVPKEISKANRESIDQLNKLSGSDFDKQYMTAMITGHQEAVADFQKESQDKAQTPVDKWAATALPTLQEHLAMAKKTGKEVGATGEPAAIPASAVEHGSKKK